jgi:hypothetical protein
MRSAAPPLAVLLRLRHVLAIITRACTLLIQSRSRVPLCRCIDHQHIQCVHLHVKYVCLRILSGTDTNTVRVEASFWAVFFYFHMLLHGTVWYVMVGTGNQAVNASTQGASQCMATIRKGAPFCGEEVASTRLKCFTGQLLHP